MKRKQTLTCRYIVYFKMYDTSVNIPDIRWGDLEEVNCQFVN
jgi:hypothetical protein